MSAPTHSPTNTANVSYPTYPPYPVYPPMPPRRSRRTPWTALGIGAALFVLLASVVGFVLVPRLIALAAPFDATKAFCNDLVAQDYDSAYAMLTPAFQAQITRDQFVQDNHANDARDGRVQSCGEATHGDIAPSQIHFNLGDTQAQFTYVFSRSQRDFVGLVSLVKSGGAWKLDSIDASLLNLPR
jgi:hypothetical protein